MHATISSQCYAQNVKVNLGRNLPERQREREEKGERARERVKEFENIIAQYIGWIIVCRSTLILQHAR